MSNQIDDKIVLGVDIPKTAAQINSDIKKLQKQLSQIKMTGALDSSSSAKQINAQISALQSQLKAVTIKANMDTTGITSVAKNTGTNISLSIASGMRQASDAIDTELQSIGNRVSKVQSSAAAVKNAQSEIAKSTQKVNNAASINSSNETKSTIKEAENSMNGLLKLSAAFKKQMSQAARSISQWLSINTAVTYFIAQTKSAIKELKQVDTLLTEISSINDRLSRSDLERIGNNAFDIAGKYGKSAADYLSAFQEALRAGYQNAEAIAELSLAAQNAGDMTAELADQMIAATNNAYGMNGSVSELTKALDGMNEIASRHGITMTDLSDGMSIAGSTAASLGVNIDELMAALSTMIAATQQSGSEAANAFRSILLYIGQMSDEEAGIDAKGLAKYEAACNTLNVRLKETKNGILSLRDPMAVLEELAAAYQKLDENDTRRTDLLNSVGSGSDAAQLDALLRQWDTYESMLKQFADGTGSIAKEAEQTVHSWEGSMKRLSNTWTATLGNVANSDAIVTTVNGLNSLLSVVNHVTDKLGSLGTIGLGAGLFAGIKNAGRVKRNPILSNMPVTV